LAYEQAPTKVFLSIAILQLKSYFKKIFCGLAFNSALSRILASPCRFIVRNIKITCYEIKGKEGAQEFLIKKV